jgi:predicted nucleic acid-binding protein
MLAPVLVDTDVMVDFLRGESKAGELIKQYADRIILSSIVLTELYAGVKGEQELATLDGLTDLFRIIPVTAELARSGGLYKRDFAKSHGIGLADGIIAATAVAENADLKTLNVRHYPMIRSLQPAYLKP